MCLVELVRFVECEETSRGWCSNGVPIVTLSPCFQCPKRAWIRYAGFEQPGNKSLMPRMFPRLMFGTFLRYHIPRKRTVVRNHCTAGMIVVRKVVAFAFLSLVLLAPSPSWCSSTPDHHSPTVLVKIGGSSITDKAQLETLDTAALTWFAKALGRSYKHTRYIIVHGAGSFGHFVAKEYGLRGQTSAPIIPDEPLLSDPDKQYRRHYGLSLARASVQRLNHAVVHALLLEGVPAIGISPGFGIPGMEAHGGDIDVQDRLVKVVEEALDRGLVPVLHGDACLYGPNGVGILSGDTLMEILGSRSNSPIHRTLFLTDVDGVYTADPRTHENAKRIPKMVVSPSGDVTLSDYQDNRVDATGSSHSHDVTGGFKVCVRNEKLESITRDVPAFSFSISPPDQVKGSRSDSIDRQNSYDCQVSVIVCRAVVAVTHNGRG